MLSLYLSVRWCTRLHAMQVRVAPVKFIIFFSQSCPIIYSYIVTDPIPLIQYLIQKIRNLRIFRRESIYLNGKKYFLSFGTFVCLCYLSPHAQKIDFNYRYNLQSILGSHFKILVDTFWSFTNKKRNRQIRLLIEYVLELSYMESRQYIIASGKLCFETYFSWLSCPPAME